MSENRKVGFVLTAENETKQTFEEVKRDAASMAQSVEQSGKTAAKGIEAVSDAAKNTGQGIKQGLNGAGDGLKKVGDEFKAAGEESRKSSEKIDGATRSIINSIQRATAAAEAGEKGTSKYFENLARQRNINADVLEPYLAQMRQVEAAQAAASKSLGGMEMSAKQTTAALRGVPAQFTDIIVSLQGGQAPLTVFLQQGGQLKDMFGGAGAAARALGGYVLSLISPLSVLAAGVAAVGAAYYQGSKEQDAFLKSIVMTGNAAGVTVGQLQEYARQMSEVSGTQAAAAESLAAFVSAGVTGGQELKRYAQTAIEWEKATGQAVSKTAEQFASLQKDPLAAVLKLNEGTNFLTAAVYEQVKALEEQGDKMAAAEVAMNALDAAMLEHSKTIRENLGYLERAWKGVAGAAAGAWDSMLGVGRSETTEDKLARIRTLIANKEASSVDPNSRAGQIIQADIAALRQEEWALQGVVDAEIANATAKAESAKQTQSLIEFDKKYSKALEEKVSLEQKLTTAREQGIAAGKSEAEIQRVLTWITEEHNKANKTSVAGANASRSAYQSLMSSINEKTAAMEKEAQTGKKLTEAEKLRIDYQELLATKGKKLTAQQRANIEAGLAALEVSEQQRDAARQLAKAQEEEVKALERRIQKQEAQIASVLSSVEKMRLEEDAHAMAAAANISHAEAIEMLTIARLEEAAAKLQGVAGSEAELERINREIAARKELLGVMGQREAREANKKAAEQAAKEWDRTAQTIGDTLADYIMSGGKDGAEYLKRLFSTLVLQPIVQASVGGMMQSIGLGGAGGGAGMVGLVQDGSSLYSTFSGGLTGSFGAAIAGIGTAIGSSAATAFGSGVIAGGNLGLFGGGISQGLAAISGGSTAAGMGTVLGAAMPWVAGIGAVLSLVSGMLGGGTDDYGAAAKYSGGKLSDSGKAYTYAELTQSYAEGLQKPMDNLAKLIGSSLDGLTTMFGGKAGYSVTTGYTSDDDDPSRGIFIVENADGETLKKWLHYRSGEWGQRATGYSYDSDPEKGYDDYLKSVAAATIPIFKDIVPDWADAMLDGLVQQLGYSGEASDWKSIESGGAAMEALQQVLTQIAQVEAGFESLGKAMSIFSDLSDDMKTGLLAAAGSMENLTAIAGSYYNAVYSEEERMRAAAEQLDKQLADMGIFGERGGLSVYDEDAKAKLRQAVDELMDAGNSEAATKLMAMAASFVEIADWGAKAAKEAADAAKQAYEEARQAAIDAAWRNLESAVDRESELLRERLGAVQESISTLESMRSMLKTNADALYGTVSAAAQMQAVQGMLYIEDALDAVRRGAGLTGYSGLSDAVTAARGGLSNGVYVSQFDKDRDALVLANQLSELEGAAGLQLSVEERQLKVLQEQIDYYARMLEAGRELVDGIDMLIDRTLTPEAAYELLMRALHGDKTEGSTVTMQGGPHPSSSSSGGHAGVVSSSSSSAYDDYMRRASLSILGDSGAIAQNREIKDVALSYSGTGDIAGLWSAVTAAGGNQYDIQKAYGWDIDDIERVLREQGVPGFAAGGLHSGGIRLVGERGPELEVTGPARYWDASKTMQMLQGGGGGSDALAAEVRALREDQRAQAGEIVRLNARIARLLERWDGGGMPQQRQEAAV